MHGGKIANKKNIYKNIQYLWKQKKNNTKEIIIHFVLN